MGDHVGDHVGDTSGDHVGDHVGDTSVAAICIRCNTDFYVTFREKNKCILNEYLDCGCFSLLYRLGGYTRR